MRILICTLMMWLALPTLAEVTQFGRYDIHHSIFATDFLEPPIAASYGITRAGDRAMINIAVRRRLDTGGDEAVRASVTGTRSDLVHKQPLTFREIVEQNAIYYITDFEFLNEETLYFEIDVTPDGESAVLSIDFNKKLYVD